jgi:hypothetical protein
MVNTGLRDNAGISSGSGVVHTAGRGVHGNGASVESMMSAESGSTASFLENKQNNYHRNGGGNSN